MAQAAADKGLQVLGITEHGPSIQGTCPIVYFRNMFVVPRQMYGIRILMGCEVNILDTEGHLDLDDEYLDRLDIGIAGIHGNCWKGGDKTQNTEGMLAVIHNPKIHIISTLLEINNHSLAPQRHKSAARVNNLELLRLCKKYDVPTILGSDAHISFQIADYDRILPLLAETDFPDELILNFWPDRFFEYLGLSTS